MPARPWWRVMYMFVLPSLSESFGVVQLEAMACRKPVVATYNGGSEEIITSEEYGLLCQPANPKELAEKILLALDKK
jgi:teichuronic acid biosynthesis glycosyltransferase TuaC